MFKDERRDKVWNEIRQLDLRAFGKFLPQEMFDQAALQAGVRVGCSALNVVNLVWLGIATAIQHTASFAFVLTTTLKLLEDQETFYSTALGKQKQRAQRQRKRQSKAGQRSKHDPYGTDPTEVSEEAFAQARQRMPLSFWMALLTVLAERFEQDHSRHLHFRDFRLLAMDGTMLPLANVSCLREHYGRPKNSSRKKAAPQARMVMITLPGTRIPIAYEVSPLAESEVTLAGRLMQHVRADDLLLMDRGFLTYGLFWQIQLRGAYFCTRLKKNIKYKRLKALAHKDWLVEWKPKDSRGQWKDLPRSIQLRVIHYQFPGFRASALVTNMLDAQRLPRADWLRLARDCDDNGKLTPGLYHRRWEIETTYFELKVVLKTKSLRSRTPASLEYELAGRVIYYLLIRWLIVVAAEKYDLDPLRISFTNAVREVELMRMSFITGSAEFAQELLSRLLARIADHTVPSRPGRHYPRPNDTKPKHRGGKRRQQPAKLSSRVNTNARRKQRSQA